MLVKELRTELVDFLRKIGSDSPEADVGLVIMHTLKIDKTHMLMGDLDIPETKEIEIRECAERLAKGEPVQYIIGKCEFMSLPFVVTEDVLIPRSDTEILVEAIIERLGRASNVSIMDIGCGSGCIGISLAYYMKNASVYSIDISENALRIAEKNAKTSGVLDRITFQKMDILTESTDECFDCVVSNPPYICSGVIDDLESKVKSYEPKTALDGGADGLCFYERISKVAKVKEGGILAFEIGYDQGRSVVDIMKNNGYTDIELLKDIEGRDRVVIGKATKLHKANKS